MAKKSYQELKRDLDEVLAWFEEGGTDLDKAMERYEQGMKIVAELESYLKQAENKVSKIKADSSGGA